MTPTVVYSAAVSANAGSISVADNAAMVEGDLRLVWISASNTTVSTPTGWTLLVTYALATTRNGYVFSRRHPGASETGHTFTLGAANNHGMAQVGVRGADLGALDFTPTTATAASGTPTTATGTTLRPDELLLASFHVITTAAGTMSTPGGMASVITQAGNGAAGHTVAIFSETEPTPAAIGTRASTPSVGTTNPWGATMLAVPAGVVLPGPQPNISRQRAANY